MTEQEKWLAEASKRLSEIAELNGMLPQKIVYDLVLGGVSFEEVDEYIEAKKKVFDFEMKYFKTKGECGFIF